MVKTWKAVLGAALAATGMATVQPADAAWFEARTNHFVLVTDSTPERTRDYAARLERFDIALRQLYNIPDNPDLHSRPVTIYALEPAAFMTACHCAYSGLLGWYQRRLASPTITVVTSQKEKEKFQQVGYLNSQALLLHEYSHHFMLANSRGAYPYWYVEGFAEFNANATFAKDDALLIGYPANYRGGSLMRENPIPLRRLVAPEIYGFGSDVDQTYGRAWLLTHYLMVRPERAGQLSRYLDAMSSGKPSLQAAQEVFGDFDTLDRDLDRYIRADIIPLRVPAPKREPEVSVRPMSAGEGQALLLLLSARRGIDKGYGKNVALQAANYARTYGNEQRVQTMLAEVAFLARRFDQADQLAERALELDPGSAGALLIKGQIATARAVDAAPRLDSAWAAGRKWFAKANRADPNWPEPFYRYYSSFLFAGEQPPANALMGLERAHVLAPENQDITWAMIREALRKGEARQARAMLVPLASAPHRRKDENKPAQLISLIDANQLPQAFAAVEAIWRKARDKATDD
jgi:hypothetical protein